MAVENNVNLQNVTNQYQTKVDSNVQNKGNPNAVDKTPDKDTVQLSSNHLTNKEKAGIAAVVTTAVAITLAVLGRNGHLGEGVKKILGGKAKEIKNAVQETVEHTKTTTSAPQVKQEAKVGNEVKAKVEQEAKVTEQTVKPEPVKMEMTEEAKKVYDNVSSKLNQKTEITADTIDANLKPREKDAVWSVQDRHEYYTQLEQDSIKNKQEAQKILNRIEENSIQTNKIEQKAEVAQTVYGAAPLERGLSHKSAKESAEVFDRAISKEIKVQFSYLREVSNSHDSSEAVRERIMKLIQSCESFKKVNKTVEINRKPVKIIYEGLKFDVTENGELLVKEFNPVSEGNWSRDVHGVLRRYLIEPQRQQAQLQRQRVQAQRQRVLA